MSASGGVCALVQVEARVSGVSGEPFQALANVMAWQVAALRVRHANRLQLGDLTFVHI